MHTPAVVGSCSPNTTIGEDGEEVSSISSHPMKRRICLVRWMNIPVKVLVVKMVAM